VHQHAHNPDALNLLRPTVSILSAAGFTILQSKKNANGNMLSWKRRIKWYKHSTDNSMLMRWQEHTNKHSLIIK
jgi:hypothetical protein